MTWIYLRRITPGSRALSLRHHNHLEDNSSDSNSFKGYQEW